MVIAVSICGCSSDEQISYGRTTLAYEQTLQLSTSFETVAILHHKLKEGCRDKLNLMFVVAKSNEGLEQEQILVNDLYMLDLDTGFWYFEDAVDTLGTPGFETKEAAFAYFYNTFDSARKAGTERPELSGLDYLSEQEVDYVNALWQQKKEANVLAASTGRLGTFPISWPRREELALLTNQPAGLAKGTIASLEEAVTYLQLRVLSLAENPVAEELSGDGSFTLRCAAEVLEDYDRPVAKYDIASCVAFLLGDNFEVDILAVFLSDGSLHTINMIRTDDGYWFVDPLALMNPNAEMHGVQLPEWKCESADAYVEYLQQNAAFFAEISHVFLVEQAARVDFKITNAGDFTVKTESAAAEQVYCRNDG